MGIRDPKITAVENHDVVQKYSFERAIGRLTGLEFA